MAEHRVSEALPVGPTQLLPEQQKAQEIKKEPVGESPSATESQKSELPSSNENSNSETLIAFPSLVLDQRSFGTPQFPLCLSFFSNKKKIKKKIVNCLVDFTDVQGIPNTLNSVVKSEIKVR